MNICFQGRLHCFKQVQAKYRTVIMLLHCDSVSVDNIFQWVLYVLYSFLCNRIASTTDWMYVIARKGGKVSIECTGAFPISFFPLNVIFPLWTIFRKVISLQTAYYLREEKLVKTMMKLENAKLIRATCNITPAPDNRNNRQGIWNILSNFGL